MKIINIKWVLSLCFCLCLFTFGYAQQAGLSLSKYKEGQPNKQLFLKGTKEIEFAYERNGKAVKVIGHFEHQTTSFIRVVPTNSFNYLIFNRRQSEIPRIIPINSLVHLKTQKTLGSKLLTGLSYGVGFLGATFLAIAISYDDEFNNGNKEVIRTGSILLGVSIPVILIMRKKTYKIKHGPWSVQ